MRTIVFLLVLANLCIAAYSQIGAWANPPDPTLAAEKPERMTLLSAQQVAALGPSKVAQLNLSCAEWGPFSEKERPVVQQVIDGLQLGKTVSTAKVEIAKPFAVMTAPSQTRGAMERVAKKIRDQNVSDATSITEAGANQYAISFGVFRNEALARTRLAEIEEKGVEGAKVVPREQGIPGTTFIIREPTQATAALLEEAKTRAPTAPFAFVACRDRPA